ncbi:MAG: hypothetical protein PHO31_03590 [Candidatus Pacebacteria bacterium]|nr:hypothetical protein [Candidatus Paceibacterota bacterium]
MNGAGGVGEITDFLYQFLYQLMYFFQSSGWRHFSSWLFPVCMIFCAAAFVSIIYFIIKSGWHEDKFLDDLKELRQGAYVPVTQKPRKKWNKIVKRIESKNPDNWKIAVLESGELVNEIIKKMGYEGENFLERLEGIGAEIVPNIEGLKKAAKVYLNIIDDPDYNVSHQVASDAVEEFKIFLTHFEYL